MSRPVGILLAAGLGTRYDPTGATLKLLQPVRTGAHAGVPIVVAAARNLQAVAARTIAVVRPLAHAHQRHLHQLLQREGGELAICERAALGIGASLACGVQACMAADGWIVALGDMPAVDPATIALIAQALAAGHITVAPAYRGQRGHPVGFSSRCLDLLLHCDGDVGARVVLDRFPPHVIDVDDDGVLLDIDQR